jgi:GNAT superfamily N-acetyltransferase
MLLRPAHPDDALAVASVHVRSWQAAYRSLLPYEYLDQLRPEDRAAGYDFSSLDPARPQTIVACEDLACEEGAPDTQGDKQGAILGFASIMPSSDANLPRHGELCALYVNPAHWGRGIGLALVSAARASLLERGFQNALLCILAGNQRADRFYRNDGWAPDGLRKTDTLWGVTVEELRYQRPL